MTELLLDAAGRRRSPATMLGFHAGRSPRNKAIRHPAEARQSRRPSRSCAPAGDGPHGFRLRGLIVVLWRAGLRIHEALALTESHLDRRRGSLLVCYSKGGRRREVGMDDWGWKHLQPRFDLRLELSIGSLFCVINGPSRGRPWSAGAVRTHLRRAADAAGVRRRSRRIRCVTPTRSRWPTKASRRSSSSPSSATANLGITSIYLQGIDNAEIIDTVHARRAPIIPVSATLRL